MRGTKTSYGAAKTYNVAVRVAPTSGKQEKVAKPKSDHFHRTALGRKKSYCGPWGG